MGRRQGRAAGRPRHQHSNKGGVHSACTIVLCAPAKPVATKTKHRRTHSRDKALTAENTCGEKKKRKQSTHLVYAHNLSNKPFQGDPDPLSHLQLLAQKLHWNGVEIDHIWSTLWGRRVRRQKQHDPPATQNAATQERRVSTYSPPSSGINQNKSQLYIKFNSE